MNTLLQLLMRRTDQLKSIIHSAIIHEGGHHSEVQKHFNLIEQIKKDLADEEPLSCGHKWVHMELNKQREHSGHQTHFVRTDTFFCEKCLEYKRVVQDEYSRETPDWF